MSRITIVWPVSWKVHVLKATVYPKTIGDVSLVTFAAATIERYRMSTTSPPAAKLSRRKKFCFSAAAVLLALVVIELLSWLAVQVVELDSASTLRMKQQELAQGGGLADNASETIHPYVGWVVNPQVKTGTDFFGRHVPVNSLGFLDEEHGIPKRSADRLIVGIAGASVAWQMSVAGEKTLRERLRKDPRFRDREIQIIRMAMSGYKQPQQLMQLNYLLALGAEFDVVVNVDGYNEMALAVCENYDSNVFVAYPRMWHARMQDVVDPRVYSLSYRLLQTRATRQQLATDRLDSPLSWSSTLNLIWHFRNQRLENQLLELGTDLRRQKNTAGLGFGRLGPSQLSSGEEGAYRDAVEVWKNCSRQMHRLCRGNGIVYVHCLQPNQYFPGSKPMGETERLLAWIDRQKYGESIAKGYPLLISQGKSLRDEGIAFQDLTMLFSKIEDPIYADPFCHYNQHGNDLLAAAVGERIIDAVEAHPP